MKRPPHIFAISDSQDFFGKHINNIMFSELVALAYCCQLCRYFAARDKSWLRYRRSSKHRNNQERQGLGGKSVESRERDSNLWLCWENVVQLSGLTFWITAVWIILLPPTALVAGESMPQQLICTSWCFLLQIFLATSHGKLRSYSTSAASHGQPVLKEELPVRERGLVLIPDLYLLVSLSRSGPSCSKAG